MEREISIQQQRKNWLDTHLQVYLDDPTKRSVNKDGDCMYRGLNNTCCMIGQDILDDKYSEKLEFKDVENYLIIEVLPQSTLDLGTGFLKKCQWLHDNDIFWTDTGLSKEGEKRYDFIVKEFC